MKNFDTLLDEQMEDPEFRKEYVRLLDEARSRANARADIAEARLAAVVRVLTEWGALDDGGFDSDFAEAIQESGAWRLSRDLRAALATGTTTDLRSN